MIAQSYIGRGNVKKKEAQQCPKSMHGNMISMQILPCMGVWPGSDWERTFSYLQSAQIIPLRACSRSTALAFWLSAFVKHVWSDLSGLKKSKDQYNRESLQSHLMAVYMNKKWKYGLEIWLYIFYYIKYDRLGNLVWNYWNLFNFTLYYIHYTLKFGDYFIA